MKSFRFFLVFFVLIVIAHTGFAQDTGDAQSLTKEAVQLNKAGKYAEAVDKYSQALKLDPENIYANYGMAFSLLASEKGKEGIPYLQKVINSNSSITIWAYDLLGSIYDKEHDSAKAIEAFKAGLKLDPKYQSIYYNLGLVYFRDRNYAGAEKCAIESMKLDPKHASSQRMYALVCFHQNKRANALLGLCSFILLEPNTARTTEAYGNITHILQGGILLPPAGTPTLMVDANSLALNNAISKAIADADKKKYPSPADQLTAELTNIFTAIGQLADKQNADPVFKKYFADYFYQLAQSPNMPAFARMINWGNTESAKWISEHPQYMNDLDGWVKTTARDF
ncbi:tetratricopeptide repeat protein [Mucilaginibacter gotjawali]|uniref:Tetratricopeptide (TPR) repeat protein n=2 Tax=Mucilaginibacter gotjawali TaxID=1550579 RepID=A0A839SL68_9SPHI|nr:tetratricopeptide repeat protein [Mucilaginibacter gotjawali]MBB3058043.1 tetratricopeptide (TPR) repeat protein [Mucilaginibacter gotjawali]BAU52018.1 lipoprotein NlpI [Mucilaginibacter gotjawali]